MSFLYPATVALGFGVVVFVAFLVLLLAREKALLALTVAVARAVDALSRVCL